MKIELSKAQRSVIFVFAGAIFIFQLSVFSDDGIHGSGWVFSFLVVTGLLVLGLSGLSLQKFRSSSSTQQQPTDHAAKVINNYARETAALVAKLAAKLETHFRQNKLDLAVKLPGTSLATESIFPVFALATIAYLERKDPLLRTEYIVFRDIVSKALCAMIAQQLDNDADEMTKGAGLKPNSVRISTGMKIEIATVVGTRLAEQHQLAMNIIQNKEEPRQSFLPIYRAIAVGQKVADNDLVNQYEMSFLILLDQLRENFSSRVALDLG